MLTFEGFLSSVDDFVSFEDRFAGIGFAAFVAYMLHLHLQARARAPILISLVTLDVSLKGWDHVKGLAADRTSEVVSMVPESRSGPKAEIAFAAPIRSVSRVAVHVHLEDVFPPEALFAHQTLERPFIRVAQHVGLERVLLREA